MHKINLNDLQKEVGIESAEGIGIFLQMKNPKGVYNWAKDKCTYGTRPSYNDIIRLLQKGATTKTLFGVDCNNVGPKHPDTPELRAGQQPRKPIDHNDPEWQKLVKNALAEMKQNGQL